jgi:beta-glucosidase
VDTDELVGRAVKVTTAVDGIRSAVSPNTKVLYARGCDNLDDNRDGFHQAVETAKMADAVILVLGDRSGMTPDSTSGETRDSVDLRLPGVQEELVHAILATGKPVVVVLINGRPFAIPWLDKDANAILEAWLPGEEGGAAIADILFGDANPGGKLPITFPRHVGQLPIFYNHKPSGMKSNWYVDYVSEKVTPLYPFGHGLSYTSFEYQELSIKQKQATGGETVDISLKVKNIGKVAGDEVIQLYVCDEYASLPRPVKELKGYSRVGLNPDETCAITFHLPVNQLAFYDEDLQLIIESGRIKIMLGSSSDDIRLRGEFEIVGGKKMMVNDRVFVCPVSVE